MHITHHHHAPLWAQIVLTVAIVGLPLLAALLKGD